MTQTMAYADLAVRARFFRSLADSSRLALLEALRARELSAGEAAEAAGLTLSNASRHLACLHDCGLVESRQVWRHVYYRLAGPHVTHMLAEADAVLKVVAERVAACARPEMDER